jgi:CheY-like chemotaxis protein
MKSILLVDDEPTFAATLKEFLVFSGYEVDIAHDGAEAMERLRYRAPDLLLFDIMMPKMDGYVFARKVKADPRLKAVPMIAITAVPGMRGKKIMDSLGIVGYLEKPIDNQQLLQMIRDAIA